MLVFLRSVSIRTARQSGMRYDEDPGLSATIARIANRVLRLREQPQHPVHLDDVPVRVGRHPNRKAPYGSAVTSEPQVVVKDSLHSLPL